MPVPEKDVSILIPAYQRPGMTLQAIRCALATQAGEIIVSEDAGDVDLKALCAGIDDPRLVLIQQPVNLGLWQNHFQLLGRASGAWIKFLQTDDYFEPELLRDMCVCATETTALVFAFPVYKDLHNNNIYTPKRDFIEGRFISDRYLARLCVRGNEPGRPSYCLYRRDTLPTDAGFWDNLCSVDLVINVLSASKGDVIALPPGRMLAGIHAGQEGANQSLQTVFQRSFKAVETLLKEKDVRIRKFCAVYGVVEYAWLQLLFLMNRSTLQAAEQDACRAVLRDYRHALPWLLALRHGWSVLRYALYKGQ